MYWSDLMKPRQQWRGFCFLEPISWGELLGAAGIFVRAHRVIFPFVRQEW
jgi:hypothetical protein